MTKTAILVLAIAVGVEFLQQFATGLIAAMMATGDGALPNWAALIVAVMGGLLASGKFLMPILKAMLVDYGVKMNGETSPVSRAVSALPITGAPPVVVAPAPKADSA